MPVTVRGLVDTGALVALLDKDDDWHAACVEAFAELPLPLGTTIAVLTELFHLVGESKREVMAAWNLLRSGSFHIIPVGQDDLQALEALMIRYADRPMDFTDATLVLAAERLNVANIFTVDHDDFETYRIGARKRFVITPARH
jgi:hypothetical protein